MSVCLNATFFRTLFFSLAAVEEKTEDDSITNGVEAMNGLSIQAEGSFENCYSTD